MACGTSQGRLWTRFKDPRAKAWACRPKYMPRYVLVPEDPLGVDEIQ